MWLHDRGENRVRRSSALALPELCQNPHLFWLLRLAFERKTNAQGIVNKQEWKRPTEVLEMFRRLAQHETRPIAGRLEAEELKYEGY